MAYNNPQLSTREERSYAGAFLEILTRLETMTAKIQDAPAPDFATQENFEAMSNLCYYLEKAQGSSITYEDHNRSPRTWRFMTKKPGRPPNPPGQSKTEVFHVRCTPTEKKEYQSLKQYLDDQRKEQQGNNK